MQAEDAGMPPEYLAERLHAVWLGDDVVAKLSQNHVRLALQMGDEKGNVSGLRRLLGHQRYSVRGSVAMKGEDIGMPPQHLAEWPHAIWLGDDVVAKLSQVYAQPACQVGDESGDVLCFRHSQLESPTVARARLSPRLVGEGGGKFRLPEAQAA